MSTPIQIKTTVLAGGRIEISSPDLQEGQVATVTITVANSADRSGLHVLDLLANEPGHRLFKTTEEVDAYIREERDSWDR